MSEEHNLVIRQGKRYDNITIGLRCLVDGQWEGFRAIGWNEVGFNFYLDHEIKQIQVLFKRGLVEFQGTIVWSALNISDDVISLALINELLYQQAARSTDDEALHARLVRLIRTPWMIAEKRSMLASLGLNLTDAELDAMVTARKEANPMFRYGVRVDSPAWNEIVQKALTMSSTVTSFEKISEAFTKK